MTELARQGTKHELRAPEDEARRLLELLKVASDSTDRIDLDLAVRMLDEGGLQKTVEGLDKFHAWAKRVKIRLRERLRYA